MKKRAAGDTKESPSKKLKGDPVPECTCGTCIDGWLSPRMFYRIKSSAVTIKDEFGTDLEQIKTPAGKPIPAKKQREMAPIKSIPPEVRKAGIYLPFLQGYSECFGAIKKCLLQKQTPTLEHLKVFYPKEGIPATDFNHFLEKGGKVEWALEHVVSTADAETGLFHDEYGRSIYKELYESPYCSNDGAFDLVCFQLTGKSSYGGSLEQWKGHPLCVSCDKVVMYCRCGHQKGDQKGIYHMPPRRKTHKEREANFKAWMAESQAKAPDFDFDSKFKYYTESGINKTIDEKLDALRLLMRSFASSNFGDTLMVNNKLTKLEFQKRCKVALVNFIELDFSKMGEVDIAVCGKAIAPQLEKDKGLEIIYNLLSDLFTGHLGKEKAEPMIKSGKWEP